MHVFLHVTGTAEKDEEVPPPLPQRTPESYILAADAGGSWNISGISELVFNVGFTAVVIMTITMCHV